MSRSTASPPRQATRPTSRYIDDPRWRWSARNPGVTPFGTSHPIRTAISLESSRCSQITRNLRDTRTSSILTQSSNFYSLEEITIHWQSAPNMVLQRGDSIWYQSRCHEQVHRMIVQFKDRTENADKVSDYPCTAYVITTSPLSLLTFLSSTMQIVFSLRIFLLFNFCASGRILLRLDTDLLHVPAFLFQLDLLVDQRYESTQK